MCIRDSAHRGGNRRLRHPAFAQQHDRNALAPHGIPFPVQRCLQPPDLAFVAFYHLFPPNQMVKANHTSRRSRIPVPGSAPSTAKISIQPAMEAVLSVVLSTVSHTNGVDRPWLLISDNIIVDWLSASKSVQSMATTIFGRCPTA